MHLQGGAVGTGAATWLPTMYELGVDLLLANGADVNSHDGNGRTPLHLAAVHGRTQFANLLVAEGADVNARDKERRTPLAEAIANGHQEIAQLLREHRAVE